MHWALFNKFITAFKKTLKCNLKSIHTFEIKNKNKYKKQVNITFSKQIKTKHNKTKAKKKLKLQTQKTKKTKMKNEIHTKTPFKKKAIQKKQMK